MNIKKVILCISVLLVFNTKIKAQAGACLDFDGLDDGAVTSAVVLAAEQNIALEAKVKWNGIGPSNQVIAYNGSTSLTGYGFIIEPGTTEVKILFGAIGVHPTTYNLVPGIWTTLHLVLSASTPYSDTLKFYANRSLIAAYEVLNPILPTGYFEISCNESGTENFNGSIDEVRIWDTVLTQCEINRYLDSETAGAKPHLKASYHFNQGIAGGANPAVTSLTDDSGFGNDLTMYGFTLAGPTSNWIASGAVISGDYASSPKIKGIALKDTLCFGNTTKLTGTGGVIYSWSDGIINNTTFTPSFYGSHDYTLTGIDSYGCVNTSIKTILTSSIAPILSVVKGTELTLPFGIPDGSTIVSDWSPWVYSFTDPLPANVTITGIDLNYEGKDQGWGGSGISGSLYLTDEFLAANPLSHSWIPYTNVNNEFLRNYNYGGANTFKLYFVGWGGWQAFIRNITLTFRYKYNENPVVANCKDTPMSIEAYGAKSYSWSGGITNAVPFSLAASQVYTVTGTSKFGCTSQKTISVIANSPTITVNSGSICSGQNFTMSPSGAVSYTYSSGGSIVTPGTSTSYTVYGSDVKGCVSYSTSSVVIDTPTLTVNSGSICAGTNFTIEPTGAMSYTYSSGSNIVSPSSTNTYTVTGASSTGCLASISNSVSVVENPTITVNSCTICLGKDFTIVPTGAVSYLYSSGSNVVSPTSNSSYSVTGTNTSGCVSKIAISDVVVESCNLSPFTGVTPNGDGLNDAWFIDDIAKYPQNKVTIFSRWGNKLFEANGYDNKNIVWPTESTSLISGTYFYVLDLGNGDQPTKGWIELIKN